MHNFFKGRSHADGPLRHSSRSRHHCSMCVRLCRYVIIALYEAAPTLEGSKPGSPRTARQSEVSHRLTVHVAASHEVWYNPGSARPANVRTERALESSRSQSGRCITFGSGVDRALTTTKKSIVLWRVVLGTCGRVSLRPLE
jgi:hypothetical protein